MNGSSGYPPPPYGNGPPGYGMMPPGQVGGPHPASAGPFHAYGAPPPAPHAYGAPPPAPHAYGPPPGGYGVAPAHGMPFGYHQPGRLAYAPTAVGTGAPALKWVVLGSIAGAILCSIAGSAITGAAEGNDVGEAIGGVFMAISMGLFLTYGVCVFVWIYKSWEMLPAHFRVLRNGQAVTPGSAVGRFFIPLYNLYWYFACSSGLAAALNRALEAHGSPKRASVGLSTAASVFQIIPYLNFLIAPFLWIAYMFNVESAKREYARVSGLTS